MNIYYNPEGFGLEIVTVLDQPNLSYEFNMLVIWKDLASGELVWGTDAGCSCPMPFEDDHFNSIEDTSLSVGTEGLVYAIRQFPATERDKGIAFSRIKGFLTADERKSFRVK